MSDAEEVLITNNGYTDSAYTTCGDSGCTMAVLRAIGVHERDAADPSSVSDLRLSAGTYVSVGLLGESDSCEYCACCGAFVRHGITYPGEDYGCTHYKGGDDPVDPEDLGRAHIDLADSTAMKIFWEGNSLPRLTRGESSAACLDAGLVCSVDPRSGNCTECGAPEDTA